MCEKNVRDLLPFYYNRIFPYDPYYSWISYGNDPEYFENREFSFTLANDVYIRYYSFDTQDELEKEIKKIIPCKIDIGAVYSMKPKNNKMRPQFQPREKEVVFDIDITDYDDIRKCCSGADICKKCWKYLAVAAKILDTALREDFGYKHMLWVFSGRRGIHCWVCDERARILSNTARTAIVEYLSLVTGGDKMAKRVNLMGYHPSARRAVKIIEEMFVPTCVVEQDLLGSKEACQKFLALISDSELKINVAKAIDDCTTSLHKWNAFKNIVHNFHAKGMLKKKCKYIIEEVMVQFAYPRLDVNVTKGLNHLLKSPFCIHPKTGKVCVPFLARNADNFDLSAVPTIRSLIDEITEYDKNCEALNMNNGESIVTKSKIQDFKKTTLNKYINIFQEFLRPLEASLSKKRKTRICVDALF